MEGMPPRLRVVGKDERVGEKAGRLQVVLEDLAVAAGHIVEARAELAECEGNTDQVDGDLVRALHSLSLARTGAGAMRGLP